MTLVGTGTYVPVLPPHLHECLHAPVPFIMGVAHAVAPQTMQELDSNVVVVRIDDDTIKLADGRDAASSMPQLPFVNILTKHVDRHFKKLRVSAAKKTCGSISSTTKQTVSELSKYLTIYHHFLFGSIRKAIRDLPHAPMAVRRSSLRPDSHSSHVHDDLQRASSHGTPPGDDNAAKVTRRALPSLPAKQPRAQQLAHEALPDKTQFDFDNIERSLPRLLTAFESGHRAFLKVFLQTQQFHFYATRVAGATQKLTVVDHNLDELGTLLKQGGHTKQPATRPAPPPGEPPSETVRAAERRKELELLKPKRSSASARRPRSRTGDIEPVNVSATAATSTPTPTVVSNSLKL